VLYPLSYGRLRSDSVYRALDLFTSAPNTCFVWPYSSPPGSSRARRYILFAGFTLWVRAYLRLMARRRHRLHRIDKTLDDDLQSCDLLPRFDADAVL
jgi:hypothetical protein